MTYKYRVCMGHETLAEFEYRRAAMAYARDWSEANGDETVRVNTAD